ncbi:high mobility group protein 20A-like protein, partial [Euroglyphus maynei]
QQQQQSLKRKYVRRKTPEERKRRGPRTKDLNAPKMPLNGYVRYLNANRERIKRENPDLTFAEITKKLAAEW